MANILTAAEGAAVLRCETTDAEMLNLLPLVDAFIKDATGRDWAADTTIRPEAKSAARMLLVRWHEDPGGMAAGSALGYGLTNCLVQLEALALTLETAGIPDEPLNLVSSNLSGEMAVGANLILAFNHALIAGATSDVILQTSAGVVVASTNSLDATAKILTVNPDVNLSVGSQYKLVINHVTDIYGQTFEAELSLWTEPA